MATIVSCLTIACSNDNTIPVNTLNKSETIILTAYQPGAQDVSRVGFDRNGKAYWHTDDIIGVLSNGNDIFNPFSLLDGAGTGAAYFRGNVVGGIGKYAIYPYNENHKIEDTTLSFYLPNKYTYSSVDNTFFPTGNDGNSFSMPMLGTISEENVVSFTHLAGVICLNIDKMPAESGSITITSSDNQLCGIFNANLTDDTPEIKTFASTTNRSVTIDYSGATEENVGVFYLPVATGSYNLTIIVTGNNKQSSTSVNVEMKRTRLQVLYVTSDYKESSESSDKTMIIDGHKFVDLALPSGLLWAETNLGATDATGYGDYYAWGETTTKENYSWSTYSYGKQVSSLSKYNATDGKTQLESTDDAAYVNWGSYCHIPTLANYQELTSTDNCTWTYTYKYTIIRKTKCYRVAKRSVWSAKRNVYI